MQKPRHLHLAVVRHILRYLHETPGRGLFFSAGNPLDASCLQWSGCPTLVTRRLDTGRCIFLCSSLISWKCKKQARVSKFSTESEYRAMSAAFSEIIWLRGLLVELGFSQSSPTPHIMLITTGYSNCSCSSLTTNAPRISRWSVILFEKLLTLVQYLFLIFPVHFR